jgi:hypothetical protein|tara:strand:+ start:1094 stop:1318 length:225 start_codon:yes stop_codon:yes gene_type:complete
MLGGFIIPYKKTISLRHKKSKNRNNRVGKGKTKKGKSKSKKSKSKNKRMYGGSGCNNGLQFTGKFDAIGMARYH